MGDLIERSHLEDIGIDGRIILKWIFRNWDGEGVDWIDLAWDRNKWVAVVKALMNFQVP